MYGLRHKKLTGKKNAGSGGSNQTGCSGGGIQSKRVAASNSKRRGATNTRKSVRRSADDTAGSAERGSIAAAGSTERGAPAAPRSTGRSGVAPAGSTERGATTAPRSTDRSGVAAARSTEISTAAAGSAERGGGGVAAAVNTERSNDVAMSNERSNADGNSERGQCAARYTQRTSSVRGDDDDAARVTIDVNSPRLTSGSGGDNSNLNIGSTRSFRAPAKRGRAKMVRTELAVPPRSGRVELEPVGHW